MRKTLEGGRLPTEPWYGKHPFSDPEVLTQELNALPPMEEMSPFFLTRIIYKFGLCQKNYAKDLRGVSPSPFVDIWKNTEKRWVDAVLKALPEFNPQDLSDSLYGFAALGVVPPKEFQDAFFPYAAENMSYFNSRDLASLCYSIGLLRLTPPNDAPHKFLTVYLDAITQKLPEFNTRDITTVLFTAEKREFEFPPEFWKAYFIAFADRLDDFSPKDFANNFRSLYKLKADFSGPEAEKFLSAFFDVGREKLWKSNPRDTSTIFHALAEIRIVPPKPYLDDFFSATTEKLKDYDPRNLGALMHSLAVLSLAPTNEFLKELSSMTPDRLDQYSPEQTGKILWSLAVISAIKPVSEETVAFAAALEERTNASALSGSERDLCHFACLRFFPEKAQKFQLRPWRDPLRDDGSPEKVLFLTHLTAAGFSQEEDLRYIRSLEKKMDYAFCLESAEKKKVTVLMEFDGPYAFVNSNPGGFARLRGSKRLKTALIPEACPQSVFIRVGKHEASLLESPERKFLLQELKAELPNLNPGVAYRLRINRNKLISEIIPCAELPSRAARPAASIAGVVPSRDPS